ncbi:hypothetical protein [Uliginosibacterium sp. TH139]|nr:hypothetical protein [Uliginosibacterium sp. TH139]
MTEIFAGITFADAITAVSALGITIIALHMAFKGIDLGKRAVRKA